MRDATEMDPADIHPLRRRQLGAWYTPPTLVAAVVGAALDGRPTGDGVVSVLDPACGDGRFLVEAAGQLAAMGLTAHLTGVDVDPGTAASTRRRLGPEAEIVCDDALALDWGDRRFDVVVGNPPFLSQLATATTRGGRSRFGGGAYADAAAEFLALASGLARPDGGRAALVLPLSLLATRDARPIRAAVLERADPSWLWWSPTSVFDAQVRTCAIAFVRPAGQRTVIRRCVGADFAEQPDADAAGLRGRDSWSVLISDQLGVPALPPLHTGDLLGELAGVTADFRDQYYGLVGAVGDEMDGPPLITSGLIDPGRCRWGERPVRFAKSRYAAPRVDLTRLTPALQGWAARRLVPKVLVASQTKVIEAVADPDGAWLPGVPVVTVAPRAVSAVWPIAAVLTSPVASAWVAAQMAGSGMSAAAVRVPAGVLARLPMPAGPLDEAVSLLRAGEVQRCGRAVLTAYGIEDAPAAELFAWWAARIGSGH